MMHYFITDGAWFRGVTPASPPPPAAGSQP
jgi:hypothetical protein